MLPRDFHILSSDAPALRDYAGEGGCVRMLKPESAHPVAVVYGLGRATVCIGPNNSGKSRFLRALAGAPSKWTVVPGANVMERRLRLHELRRETETVPELRPYLLAVEQWESGIADPGRVKAAVVQANAVPKDVRRRVQLERFAPIHTAAPASEFRHLWEGKLGDSTTSGTVAVYLPAYRTLRRLAGGGSDAEPPWEQHFRVAYQLFDRTEENGRHRCTVFTGESLYGSLDRLLRSGRSGRDRLAEFEDFLSRACFGGVPVSVTPREGGPNGTAREIEVKLGNDPPQRIEDMGDGVAQLVSLAFPLFENPNRLFLVEEPETHLHPAMQRAVLRLYAEKKEATVIVATHSNHLVDMACDELSDVALLRFRKGGRSGMEGKFHVDRVGRGDLELLADLGVRVSSVARVNCTVWVEGVTDRRYLAHALRLYQASPSFPGKRVLVEHLHFAFVEYGGANIVHWSFAPHVDEHEHHPAEILQLRITGTALVLADRDDGGKVWRDAPLVSQLGARFRTTAGREIENDLSGAALRAVLLHYKEDPAVVDSVIPAEGAPWLAVGLGVWLDTQLGDRRKRRGQYGDATGTVRDKTAFATAALEGMPTWESLGPLLQGHAIWLYEQILTAEGAGG